MPEPLRIGICGAGVAGLAAAAFLSRDGHRVTLLERFDAPRPLGAGLLLQPTGLACLSLLGLEEKILALGARVDGIEGRTSAGRLVLDMRYRTLRPGYFGLGVHRAALFGVLHDEVRRLGVDIVTSVEAVRVERHAKRRTLIVDAIGRHHGPYDFVVDASGIRSVLRRQVSGTSRAHPFRYGALWAAIPLPPDWPQPELLTQRYDGAGVMIGVLPIGRLPDDVTPRAAFFWSLRTDRLAAWHGAGLAAWKQDVIARWPQIADLLDAIRRPEDLAFASYADVIVPRPFEDQLGLLVIGDAAHGTSPQLGQGANLALIDAMVLAHGLRHCAGRPLEVVLADVVLARRRHVHFYQWASRWLTPFFQSDSRLAGALRDATFGIACRLPVTRTQSLMTLAGVKDGVLATVDPARWKDRYGA